MPKRDWRSNLALGGLALAALVLLVWGAWALANYQSEHRQQSEQASQYQASSARGEAQATCVQQPRSRTYRCTADIPLAEARDPYAEHDLRAQQDMARWAFAVVLVSLGSLVLTALGVVLLWLTLKATNRTLEEAEKTTGQAAIAATAAAAQAKTASDAFMAERRPWLTFEATELGEIDNKTALNIPVRIRIRNVGGSIATDVAFDFGYEVGIGHRDAEQSLSQMRAKAKVEDDFFRQERVLFPQQTWETGGTLMINDGQVRAAYPGGGDDIRVIVTIFGVARYKSLYDRDVHTTGFSVKLMRTDIAGASLPYGPKAIDVSGRNMRPVPDRTGWFAD